MFGVIRRRFLRMGFTLRCGLSLICFIFFLSRIGFLLSDQRHTVCDGDLVIVRVNFGKSQKSVAVAAIFDESRLQRRFNPRYFCEIDITFKRSATCTFEIKFFEFISSRQNNADFFRLRGVDEHF